MVARRSSRRARTRTRVSTRQRPPDCAGSPSRARCARERGARSAAGVQAVERVRARLGELCGPPEPPARLHGDLWWGNVMGDEQGRPWLIDPSAYGGNREVDLAMLRLFGAPSERL